MKGNIDFEECLKDSPKFRLFLEDSENDIDLLEVKLEKLVKHCNAMIETGKAYSAASKLFIDSVKDVSGNFKQDDFVTTALGRFTTVMSDLQKFRAILLDQAHRSVCTGIQTFIKNEIHKVKETRKHFEKISTDMDQALIKNAQVAKSRPNECEDANNVLTAMRSCFGHTALDYVFQINILHSKKRFDILDTMQSFMGAQSTFFHQGSDLFEELEPDMKEVHTKLDNIHTKLEKERKAMEERHLLVQQQKDLGLLPISDVRGKEKEENVAPDVEGYLFKRTSNAFKSWVRRWFSIEKNKLVYRKRTRDNQTVMEEDLRLCIAKPFHDLERRFCFELISPKGTHILQADSEVECRRWVSSIQEGATQAYDRASQEKQQLITAVSDTSIDYMSQDEDSKDRITTPLETNGKQPALNQPKTWQPKSLSRMQQLISMEGNGVCCDCGSPDPRWASINMGITLCIECSGIHRSLGVHISKVRSVTLDAWDTEQIKLFSELGNHLVNSVFEANVNESIVKRASPICSRAQREAWIRAKYVDKAFVVQPTERHKKKTRWAVRRRRRGKSFISSEQTTPTFNTGSDTADTQSVQSSDTDSTEVKPSSQNNTTATGEFTSEESDLGDSVQDIVIFGEADSTAASSLELEDSCSDEETKSLTSVEELSELTPNLLLYKAAEARNIPVMLEALALGAAANYHHTEEDGKTPLIQAVSTGSMAAVEFMLLNGSKVDVKDDRGRTPLHHGTSLGHTGQVVQLLKRKANQYSTDEEGKTPLSIAVDNANADIVTLLRLAKLNEEMQESEGYQAGQDQTFNDVFKDFTQMANNAPEKLNRKK